MRAAAISACFLLVPTPDAETDPTRDGRGEHPVVIRPGGDHRVERRQPRRVRGELLKARLRIHRRTVALGIGEERLHEAKHQGGRGIRSDRQVGRPDQRFDRVGQDRVLVASAGLVLTAPEEDVLAETDATGDLGEGDGRDDGGAALGERSLVEVGMLGVELDRDGLPEHRVAEELEALVVRALTVLVRVGAVCQGKRKKLGVDDDSELLREGLALEISHALQAIRRQRPCGPCTRGTARCPASR